jgi:putative SOS response-associated peptidase YedK
MFSAFDWLSCQHLPCHPRSIEMCGRFTLKTPVSDWLTDLFPDGYDGLDEQLDLLSPECKQPRYNIAPSQSIVVITMETEAGYRLNAMRWGLLPSWADSMSSGYNMINARSESLMDKPSFRPSLIHKRCILLADGYYEWKKITDKHKVPYWIHRPHDCVFAMAGLWAQNNKIATDAAHPGPILSTAVITTEANRDTSSVHDRMPIIFTDPQAIHLWLDPKKNDKQFAGELMEQLHSNTPGSLLLRPVSTAVNNPRNVDASLIHEVQIG